MPYYCGKCRKMHKLDSNIGIRHRRYEKKPPKRLTEG